MCKACNVVERALEVGFLVCNLYSTGRHKPQERTTDLRSFSIQCALFDAYKSAIESAMQRGAKETGKEAARPPRKRRYEPISDSEERHVGNKIAPLNNSEPSSASGSDPNRSRDQQLHDAVMAPSGDSDRDRAPDQRTDDPTSMGHFLIKCIAFAIYKFLEGGKNATVTGRLC